MTESSFFIGSNSNYTIFAEVHIMAKTDKHTPTGLSYIFANTLTKSPPFLQSFDPVNLSFIYVGQNMAAFNVLKSIIEEENKKALIIRKAEEIERFDGDAFEVMFKYSIFIKSTLNTAAALNKIEEIRGILVSRFCDFLKTVIK